MDRAHIKKYLRRAKGARWADQCLRRAVGEGSMYRAWRATHLTQALGVWLDKNAPLIVETYGDSLTGQGAEDDRDGRARAHRASLTTFDPVFGSQ